MKIRTIPKDLYLDYYTNGIDHSSCIYCFLKEKRIETCVVQYIDIPACGIDPNTRFLEPDQPLCRHYEEKK